MQADANIYEYLKSLEDKLIKSLVRKAHGQYNEQNATRELRLSLPPI